MAGHGKGHSHPTPKDLILNAGILTLLMILTIFVYWHDTGHKIAMLPMFSFVGNQDVLGSYLNNIIAVSIAIVKAYRVVTIFMAVNYSGPLVKMWAWAGFVWFPLMLLMFGDYATRHWEGNKGWIAGSNDVSVKRSEIDATFAEINQEKGYIKKKHGDSDDHGGH